MRKRLAALILPLAFLVPAALSAEPTPTLHPQLEAFRPLLDITFSGEFANSTPERPIVDVVRYERALNGQAIRSLHSLNDGAYGGETIYRWDDQRQTIVYHYFTTQGFMTSGTFELQDGKFTAFEQVDGSADGVTAVRSHGSFTPNEMSVQSEYLKQGEWTPGHSVHYTQTPEAKVVFK